MSVGDARCIRKMLAKSEVAIDSPDSVRNSKPKSFLRQAMVRTLEHSAWCDILVIRLVSDAYAVINSNLSLSCCGQTVLHGVGMPGRVYEDQS